MFKRIVSGLIAASLTLSVAFADSMKFKQPPGWVRRSPNVVLQNINDNAGIGSSTPGAKLDVQGTVRATNFVGNGAGITNVAATMANPSASIGLTANNGVATTAQRSDATPALSQGISPTWTGVHTFSNATNSALFTGGNVGINTLAPQANLTVKQTGSQDPLHIASSSSTSMFKVIGNGNVGINSSIPSQKLDVQGTINAINFTGNGSGIYSVPAITASSIVAMGDSITLGFYATDQSTTAYVPLLAADLGATVTNLAVGGMSTCYMADSQAFIQNPGANKSPIYIVMIGINDASGQANDGNGNREVTFKDCLGASITWLTVPSTYKTIGQSSSCVKTGSWSNSSSFGGSIGTKSSTNGNTLSCSITSYGKPIYVWYKLDTRQGGTFTAAVDGGTTQIGRSTPTGYMQDPMGDDPVGEGYLRFTGIAAGSHTVLMTVTSSTSGSNVVDIAGVGTPSRDNNWQGPKVFNGGVTYDQNDAISSTTAAFYNDVQSVDATLFSDSIPVYFIPTRNFINSTTDMFDSVHPNDSGHSHLRDAWESVMQFYPRSSPASGNIGIGTAGSFNVDVFSSGNIQYRAANTSGTGYAQYTVQNNNGQNYRMGIGGHSETAFNVADKFYIFDGITQGIRFAIDQNGNVGLGTYETGRKLSVYGNSGSSTFAFGDMAAVNPILYLAADIPNQSFDINSRANYPLAFYVNNIEKMRLTSSGLGIGTTTPSYAVTATNIGIGTNANIGHLFDIYPTSGTSATEGILINNAPSNPISLYLTADQTNQIVSINSRQNYPMAFLTNNAERMRIDAGGNVGIGTVNPTVPLQIGTPTAGLKFTTSGGITSAGNVGITTTCPNSSNWQITNGLVTACH